MPDPIPDPIPAADMDALKSKLHTTWTTGDFDRIARSYESGATAFVERLELTPGLAVLDVACGSGNLSRPAARAGATVTGVDIAANSLETARARAADEGLTIQFDEGDCEGFTYADASFDVVMSMYGAMFAPRPELVAAELLRVCKPGGRIAMANWGKFGFVFELFALAGSYAPPPPGMTSPVLWGEEPIVRERFGDGVREWQAERRSVALVFETSGAELVDYWTEYYGPINRAMASLDAQTGAKFRDDLIALWERHNRATDGTTDVEAEYLAITAVRA